MLLAACSAALAQGAPAVTRVPQAELPVAATAAVPPAHPPAVPGNAAAGPLALPPQPVADGPRPGAAAVPDALRRAAEPLPEPSEFERHVREANAGREVPRLGAHLQRGTPELGHLETPARVPPHYVMQVGDELSIALWGSVDAQWLLRIDRAGRVTLPRVGPVAVAGAPASELEPLLRKRLGQVFKAFELSAAVTQVSPVRVHLSGFVQRPGDLVVPGLSTLSAALALARGPAPGGSYRRIQLLREGQPARDFDLYDLLRDGSRRHDVLLQPGDVIHVQAAGPQMAVLGSVQRAAVFEFKPGETVADALALAGGFSSVADRDTLLIERLSRRSQQGALALSLPAEAATRLEDGDVLRARSRVSAGVPSQLRNKRVLVEGEVLSPGEYLLPPGATLADAVQAAGGATPIAFVFGTSLRRESVRALQAQNYERALRELELGLARHASGRVGEDKAADPDASVRQTLARLRLLRPEGRVLLDTRPESRSLPDIALEDGDQISLPAANQSVGVFGSVYSSGSFQHAGGRTLGHYLERAGGATTGADHRATFVVRANGSVQSAAQGGAWWSRGSAFEAQPALPGDTVFVPEDLFRGSWVQSAKDWTQILYQLGVGLAALGTIR
ncbi:SLBB domain-containing protein [Aquabacterium sp. OR-4]|uniref:SLBB domain-containing protein n=1 Tax=Aquabacterium sp. OR-4 TaxID=2978127 RepID=UPI0021B1CCF3|nr:SLBB domain-containing protein [Aquabacterium sp. OR-4]MDT7838931.1 SLBB domain-containing protein [Aquabacterium sp. OR-4]